MPVALFEEDRSAHGLSLLGVPVVGGIEDIPAAAERYSIQQVILAVSSAPPELVDRALRASEAAGVAMKVIPSVREVVGAVGHPATVRQAREPRIEDLLGRQQVATDLAAVHRSLAGKRVLITGAGGSIGSEIALQVAAFGPEMVILLDHDETHLHDAAGVLGCAHELALVDVVNRTRCVRGVRAVPARTSSSTPAAHKHVPVLETHPVEASATNVFGTRNVVDAAVATGVERFVFISTDKAVRPSSVMGASKWMAEQITLALAPANCALLRSPLRQRARKPWKRDPDVRPADLDGRSGHRHRPTHDSLLHECPRGGSARAPGIGALSRRRDLHARDG